ncbi:uncharacterized protein LOC125195473 [Salvia hispanica]|uniref:uncharacterized protein LOC125195473 n=1 Tax=Salvia hispanica TaxID=49212 RepID=UPI00200951AC|nr:uncharacterized protein LOC125195473 [Salvia hispanica]
MASSRAGGSGGGASDSDSDSDSENELNREDTSISDREDAPGKPGHTPLLKSTAAIRQLAYGGLADMFDEYLHIGESSAIECLQNFCAGIRAIFEDCYLRSPSPENCQQLINMHGSVHGFPGMLGSKDCMHLEWKNCPAAWKGMHTSGFKAKHHTMILEATIKHAIGQKKSYFASRQEAAHKDVERAFGVLQSRWAMVKGPSRMWYIPNIDDIMYACIILHNMIVESEGDELTQWTNEDDTGVGPSHVVASANVNMGVPHGEVERLRAFADMRLPGEVLVPTVFSD